MIGEYDPVREHALEVLAKAEATLAEPRPTGPLWRLPESEPVRREAPQPQARAPSTPRSASRTSPFTEAQSQVLACVIAKERHENEEAVGEALGKMVREIRQEFEQQVAELRLELTRTKIIVAELERAIGASPAPSKGVVPW